MKDLSLIVWLTQLGLSTALPLAGFILLGRMGDLGRHYRRCRVRH